MAVKNTRAMSAKAAPLPDVGRYLGRLGERVRTMRNQRGMTRKALAQYAEVSERYLAQLESGEGNCSIVLLRRIARAMGVPVARLVSESSDPPLDAVLFSQSLDRLSPGALKQVRELVLR